MKYPSRKSTRLPCYDYSQNNYYFITICTQDKRCLFGTVKEHGIYGKIAAESLNEIEQHYSYVRIDKYVVMPNHVHLILVIENDISGRNTDMNMIIGQYKSGVSRKIHCIEPGIQVWQRSFHDHVIRGEMDYQKIWQYIDTNPMRWDRDCFYTE